MEQTRYIDLYVDEMRDTMDALSAQLVRLEHDPKKNMELLDAIMRLAHTGKSSSTVMQFDGMSSLFAVLEDIFDTSRKEKIVLSQETIDLTFQALDWALHGVNTIAANGKEPNEFPIIIHLQNWRKRKEGVVTELVDVLQKEQQPLDVNTISSIRVNVRSLDALVELTKNLSQLHAEMAKSCADKKYEDCSSLLEELGTLAGDLKAQLHRCRLVPVGQIVLNFPKLVRDVAQEEGKKVDFDVFSSVSHIDKGLAERIQGPIIHLLKNAVDHGIESSEEREKAGKPKEGKVDLRIERTEEDIQIIVEDDGQLIDLEGIKTVAKTRGISDDVIDRTSAKTMIDLLSNPYFSTTDQVTSVSGRGVGLSAVRKAVESFAGTMALEQKDGKKRFVLTVPAQLSVIESLLIQSENVIYAVPEAYVERLRHAEPGQIRDINGKAMVTFDTNSMPIVWLHHLMNKEPQLSSMEDFSEHKEVVVIELHVQEQKIALAIDQLLMRDTIMIKPMSIGVLNNPLIAGPTTLPSGTEVHLLGVPDIMRTVQQLSL